MVKFFVYSTLDNRVLEFHKEERQVFLAPFNGSPSQQWDFTPAPGLDDVGKWYILSVTDKSYLQPNGLPGHPSSGTVVDAHFRPVLWKFQSLTVVPLPYSLFKLEYEDLDMTAEGGPKVTVRPDAGQITSGSQVWQLKPVIE